MDSELERARAAFDAVLPSPPAMICIALPTRRLPAQAKRLKRAVRNRWLVEQGAFVHAAPEASPALLADAERFAAALEGR